MANQHVSKVVLGSETLIDLTGDTATAEDVAEGKTFHLANGAQAVGTASGGGGGGGGTEKTITITLTNPRSASEAKNPACTIYEAEDPTNPNAQIGQIETPTGSTTVTTSASCIVVEFHTYGALMEGYSLYEYGLTPLYPGRSAGMGFYVFDSGSMTIDHVDYDD